MKPETDNKWDCSKNRTKKSFCLTPLNASERVFFNKGKTKKGNEETKLTMCLGLIARLTITFLRIRRVNKERSMNDLSVRFPIYH